MACCFNRSRVAAALLPVFLVVGPAMAASPKAAITGFAVNDLSTVEQHARSVGGKQFETRASAERLTLMCTDCEGSVAIDVLLGTSTDGTEGRFRSGATTLKQLEAQCRARDDACRLERLDIGSAAGWLSVYSRGATAVLFRDGAMLTIRSMANSPPVAQEHLREVLKSLAPRIVGR